MVAGGSGRPGIRRAVLAVVLCALALAGCVTGAPPGPGRTSAPVPDASTAAVTVDGRPAVLYLPGGRPPAPTALVVVLHGYTGDAAGAVAFFGLRAPAVHRGYLLLAPQGTTDAEGHTFWNAAHACCDRGGSAVDDSGYLAGLIAAVAADYPVDPGRVFVVGHSNGGFMALRMACEHADAIAAVASLAGAMDDPGECAPSRPVSVLQVHGTADDTIPYDGGDIDGDAFTSAATTVGRWRALDGCAGTARPGPAMDADTDVAGDDLTASAWQECRGHAGVALWTITGGTHVPSLTPAFASALLDWLDAHRR